MPVITERKITRKKHEIVSDTRIKSAAVVLSAFFLLIVLRLFMLMILQHSFYTALASGSHEMYADLFPQRGEIFITSENGEDVFPLAINRDFFTVFADTRDVEGDEEVAENVAEKLAEIFNYDDEKKLEIYYKLLKENDPYEPIEKKVDEDIAKKLQELNLTGIYYARFPQRFYPEHNLAAQVIGFVGKDVDGNDVGQYGIEGYWDDKLAGSGGFLEGVRSAQGSWIPLAGRLMKPAQDGVNLFLTIDRTLQFKTCEILKEKMETYEAQSASLIIMDPMTGAIKAMCSLPDFDPNTYNEVESIEVYNNSNIFEPYEPGSVMKPITMAAGLNEGVVEPDSYFYDTGSVDAECLKPIQNADLEVYGAQTMTGVLENSINTGIVEVVKRLGKNTFKDYLEDFGFGVSTGIELDKEYSGTIDSLSMGKKSGLDCYSATAAFGQGITVNPLQLVTAFSTIANGGWLVKPYIIDKVVYEDGREEQTKPRKVTQVLEKRTAQLLSGMLVSVIDNGQASLAQVPGYYIAGKTGTAQIAENGVYVEDTNHTFVGFGPVDDPRYVMLIKFEKPHRRFSSTTAAPTFAEISKFIMQYYHIAPAR